MVGFGWIWVTLGLMVVGVVGFGVLWGVMGGRSWGIRV